MLEVPMFVPEPSSQLQKLLRYALLKGLTVSVICALVQWVMFVLEQIIDEIYELLCWVWNQSYS